MIRFPSHRLVATCVVLASVATARAACVPSGIVLADPAKFAVKRCWTASDLAVPIPLGALRFSADGATLQVVGAADSTASAIYILPVTRDTTSREVIDVAPPTASFAGASPGPESGLDAGLEPGPAGTLFVTYFGLDTSTLAERPGGLATPETAYDMFALGLPGGVAGLAFSPVRFDPATQFGRLQVGINLGSIYEIALAPADGGLFTPGSPALFVVVQPGGLGGIQYVPDGALVYTSLDGGTVHRLAIDAATGLPLDRTTMTPAAGTSSPKDDVFASSFVPGPVGLELDQAAGDLFVATYDASVENAIYQIGGFGGGTTTTTLPPSCEETASIASIRCRLGALRSSVLAAGGLAGLEKGLLRQLSHADRETADAETRLAAGRRRPAKRALGAAMRALAGFDARLASRRARRRVPAGTLAALAGAGSAIEDDLRALVAAT